LIARGATTSTVLLKVIEESTDHHRREILDSQSVDRYLHGFGQEGKQQDECVAIASLGVAGQVALSDHMLQEETANPQPINVLLVMKVLRLSVPFKTPARLRHQLFAP
jgi:hypothetical protein